MDQHTAVLLQAAGYTCQKHAAEWEDIGGPESGPKVVGHPDYDEWTNGDDYLIVVGGEVVEVGTNPPTPEGWEQ